MVLKSNFSKVRVEVAKSIKAPSVKDMRQRRIDASLLVPAFPPGPIRYILCDNQIGYAIRRLSKQHPIVFHKKYNLILYDAYKVFLKRVNCNNALYCGNEYAIVPNVKTTGGINTLTYLVIDKNGTVLTQLQDFLVYRAYEFIFIIYVERLRIRGQEAYMWYALINNTKQKTCYKIQISCPIHYGTKFSRLLYQYHLLKKCKKVVFITGTIEYGAICTAVIDLARLRYDTNYIEKINNFEHISELYIHDYVRSKEEENIYFEMKNVAHFIDYSSGTLYIKVELINHMKPAVILRSNLCNSTNRYQEIEAYYLTIQNNGWLRKPKYIHIYDLKGLYDLLENESSSNDLLIRFRVNSSITDKSFNRLNQVIGKIAKPYNEHNFKLVRTNLQEDMITIYRVRSDIYDRIWESRDNPATVVGVIVINDLVLVKRLRDVQL